MEIQDAVTLFEHGKLVEADALCQQLLIHKKDNFNAWHLRGVIAYQTKNYQNAIRFLSKALNLAPKNTAIMHALAASHHNEHQYSKSIILYRKLCKLSHADSPYPVELAKVLEDNHQFTDASQILVDLLNKSPNDPALLFKIGLVLYKDNKSDTAEKYIGKLVKIEPNNSDAWNLLGLIRSQLNKFVEAEAAYTTAIGITENFLIAYLNLASLYQDQGKYQLAIDCYLHALRLGPVSSLEISQACYNLALIYLGQANFKKGWEFLNRRPKIFTATPEIDEIKNKSVLICGEEGIGDELVFLRFLPELAKTASTVDYVGSSKLTPLLSRINSINNVYNTTDTAPKCDYNISLMDLPYILGMPKIDSISPISLSCDRIISDPIIDAIAKCGAKPVLGISWRAGLFEIDSNNNKYLKKNIPLDQFIKVLAEFKGTIVILQRDPTQEEIQYLKTHVTTNIIDASSLNHDLNKMLCVLQKLDNYIGVSNTNMHLFGSLGKNACVIIPFPGEWRWLYSGDSSPWYPNYTLIRQSNFTDWQPVVEKARKYLDSLPVSNNH